MPDADLKEAAQKWLDTMEDGAANGDAAKAYIAALEDGLGTVDELAARERRRESSATSRPRWPTPRP